MLPAGASDVAEEYVYREDASRSETEVASAAPKGTSGGCCAAPSETKPQWDISGIARSWGLDSLPSEKWARHCDDLGIPLRKLGPLLRSGLRRLGEGTYATVFAVERDGLPTLPEQGRLPLPRGREPPPVGQRPWAPQAGGTVPGAPRRAHDVPRRV